MRYDTQVFFQHVTPGMYDSATGNYGPETVTETMRYASVTDAGTDTILQLYGELRQNVCIVRIQGHYDQIYSYIRIGEKRYRVDVSRRLRAKQTFIVSEVQGWQKDGA